MTQTIHISLCGRITRITNEAYRFYLAYVDTLHRYFQSDSSRFEIINDMESRMAELMEEKIIAGSPYIAHDDVQDIITRMGRVCEFEALACDRDACFPGVGICTLT